MTINELVGATIQRVYSLGGGGFILATDHGTISAIGISKAELAPPKQEPAPQSINLWC